MPKQTIDISAGIVIKTVLIILALWFLYLVKDIVLLLFIAVIIAAAIDPAVNFLQKKNIPRSAGALLIYLLLFSIIALVISFLIPPLGSQMRDFSSHSGQYLKSTGAEFNLNDGFFSTDNINVAVGKVISEFGNSLTDVANNIFSKTIGVFSGLISTIVVFSMAFYMVMTEDGIKKFVVSITPQKKKAYAANLTDRIKDKIGKWMAGQLVLMVIIFALDYIGLSLIGIPYALVLAILAGILEIVPYVGPIVAAVPGVILGFLVSPVTGLLALVIYTIAQQFEAHVVVPQIMKKAVGLNPVATIAAILIGFNLAGALGAIISVPAATAISLFISDLMDKE
ncbi:MAG: AI-2E family transporter [Parcubacteria group bacterium]